MDYLVYDTQNPCAFFKKIAEHFLKSFWNKISLISLIHKRILRKTDYYTKNSDDFKKSKEFICTSITQNCTVENRAVILSNVQVKFFLKVREDTYEYLKKDDDISLLMLFQDKYYTRLFLNLDHIKIISDEGKIVDSVPAIAKFQKADKVPYEQITDSQTDNIFFNGIVNSLSAKDTVRYITNNQNPPTGYLSFLTVCAGRINNRQQHCSLRNIPSCEFLRKIRWLL